MKPSIYILALAFSPVLALSAQMEIKIPREVPYQDESSIQENVLAQCKTLGSDFADHIAKALQDEGYAVNKVDALDTSTGLVFDVKITNAFSAGNAFIGHMKSVSAVVKVYKDGQPLPAKSFKRDTRGGFAGGFKGSCDVLDRSTTAIGKDIAVWYKKQE